MEVSFHMNSLFVGNDQLGFTSMLQIKRMVSKINYMISYKISNPFRDGRVILASCRKLLRSIGSAICIAECFSSIHDSLSTPTEKTVENSFWIEKSSDAISLSSVGGRICSRQKWQLYESDKSKRNNYKIKKKRQREQITPSEDIARDLEELASVLNWDLRIHTQQVLQH